MPARHLDMMGKNPAIFHAKPTIQEAQIANPMNQRKMMVPHMMMPQVSLNSNFY
jgi:hypothetical protein